MMVLNFQRSASSSRKPCGVFGGETTLTEATLTGWSLVISADGLNLKGFTLGGEVGEGVTHERTCE